MVSLVDVLEEDEELENEACAVLGGSDSEKCSYSQVGSRPGPRLPQRLPLNLLSPAGLSLFPLAGVDTSALVRAAIRLELHISGCLFILSLPWALFLSLCPAGPSSSLSSLSGFGPRAAALSFCSSPSLLALVLFTKPYPRPLKSAHLSLAFPILRVFAY